MQTLEYYPEQEQDGVVISSRRIFKGTEEHGFLEIISIIGRMGNWAKAMYYSIDKYTHEEAINKFKEDYMELFKEKKNEV